MKKMYKLKQSLKLLLMLVFVGVMGSVSAQMSGTYTIDNTAATGGTNFANWQDFRNNIVTNGVNGAVVVNVKTDITETAQVAFPVIAGVSATNTVTINGGGKFVAFSIADAVILINGADFFTFDKLIVRNTTTSQYAQGYRFTIGSDSKGSDNNTISNGTIEFSAMATGTTSGGAYISFSSSATAVTTFNTVTYGNNNTISGNLMRTTNVNSPGPTYGITCSGSSSSYTNTAQNNTITGNTIQNFYYMAVWMYYTNGNQVLNNDISRANATSANCFSSLYGIYTYYGYSTSRSLKIDGNNLHDWPFVGSTPATSQTATYAFWANQNQGLNNTTNRFSISNNTTKNLTSLYNNYHGYIYYGYYMDITNNVADNNDVTAANSSANHYGWYVFYALAYKINNNTIKNCDGSYYWKGIYIYSPQNATGIATSISGNLIENNLSAGYYFQGIQGYYLYNSNTSFLNVSDNIIRKNQAYGYYMVGIAMGDLFYTYQPSYGYVNIQRNQILANKSASNQGYVYGICSYYDYDENITDNLISDNVGYYGQYCIYTQCFISGSYTQNIRQNTLRVDGSQSGYGSQFIYAIYSYMYYHAAVNIQGNITDMKNLYYVYMVYCYNQTSSNIKIDRNSYFTTSVSNQYWYTPSGSANSFTGWASSGAPGSNEKFGDPKWNNPATYDYRSNTLMNQNNVPYNALDIRDANQVLRNTAKNDRGALEGYLDIANVSSTFAPNANECSGYIAAPTVTLKNNFIDAVTGFTMGMSVNGVLVTSALVTNNIAIGGTGTVSFNPVKFSKSGIQKVKIFLLDADDNPLNDTLTYTFNIKVSPGGSTISLNTALSAAKAKFDITGKPDITTNGQPIVYDLGPPTRVNFINTDHLFNGGSKWIATVTGSTKYGKPVPVTYNNPVGSTNAYITFNPTTAFVDSLVTICIKVSDLTSGCDTTYCRNVLVAPQGIPDFKLPAIICDKDDIFFENTSSVSSGALLSTWDFGDGSPTVDATSPVYRYNGPGTYQVKLTVVTSPFGYVTTVTKTINVNEIPTASFKNTNACEGNAVSMINTTTIGSGTLSYVWNFGDGSPTVTTVNASRTYAAAGGYKVTLKASGNGCTNTYSKNVYEFARPVAAFTHTTGSCENDLFTFTNNSTISQGEFGSNWDFNDGGNLATVENPQYDFLTPGVKNVKLEV
ncbi:MAG: PKD domain-containing protein, partial [bacterium]|nr:PKD domain-containing protein [bacterium]